MNRPFELLEVVRLRADLPDLGLSRGTQGAVVDLLRADGEAYEVEVVDDSERTVFLGLIPAEVLEPVWFSAR